MEISFMFCLLLLLIACMYSCVGHGGASGYIALMSIYEFSPDDIKPAALTLNIVVSGLAFLQFYRAGYFNWQLFYPFAVTSVPAAYIGGRVTLNDATFKFILGLLLVFPILNLLGAFNRKKNKPLVRLPLSLALLSGGLIGFLSGLIGIGGGILLSPLLLLMRWADMKETAAVSALYIFVNSIAGLSGHSSAGVIPDSSLLLLIGVALSGGFIGSYTGSFQLNTFFMKRVLAAVLLIASVKLVLV